jgi:hypothetical protein
MIEHPASIIEVNVWTTIDHHTVSYTCDRFVNVHIIPAAIVQYTTYSGIGKMRNGIASSKRVARQTVKKVSLRQRWLNPQVSKQPGIV